MKFKRMVPLLFLTASGPLAQAQEKPKDMYDLSLVEFDLQQATRLLTIYDRDEDGAIDKDEQDRLRWKDEVKDFDLNQDGRLTHLELAVREAKQRDDADVTQFDVNNVNTFLTRYDKNRNGQLDPSEIEAGWPANPEEYDANGDGILTAKEMQYRFAFNRGLRREMGIQAVDTVGANQLIDRFDQDNNGKLDRQEQATAPLPLPADDFDNDDDSMLERMELATMLAKHRTDMGLTKPDQIKIRRLFGMLDLDGDGRITDEEGKRRSGFANVGGGPAAAGDYLQYDANDDGVVTLREVERAFAKVRQERGYVEVDFQKAVRLLQRHDENRSKYIEPNELFDSPQAGQLPKSLVTTADRDKDQRISLDELARDLAGVRKSK